MNRGFSDNPGYLIGRGKHESHNPPIINSGRWYWTRKRS